MKINYSIDRIIINYLFFKKKLLYIIEFLLNI